MGYLEECEYCTEKPSVLWETPVNGQFMELREDGEPIPLVFSDDVGQGMSCRIEQGLLWSEYTAEDGTSRAMNAIAINYCPICGKSIYKASLMEMDKQTIEGY